jgi:hypothetical protein
VANACKARAKTVFGYAYFWLIIKNDNKISDYVFPLDFVIS